MNDVDTRRAPTTWRLIAGIAAVLAVAILLGPWLREQAALSFTRQPEPFLELTFADAEAQAACAQAQGAATVDVVLTSHHRDDEVDYRVLSQPLGRTPAGAPAVEDGETTGRATLSEDAPTPISASVAVPGQQAYRIVVLLEDRPERLQITCEAPGAPGASGARP